MNKIVVAVDFSDVTGKIINEAISLAQPLGSEIHLLHSEPPSEGFIFYDIGFGPSGTIGFVDDLTPDMEDTVKERIDSDKQALNALEDQIRKNDVEVTSALVEGRVDEEIVSYARKISADLIVIGNHRHGRLYKLLFDDVGTQIIKEASCPVLVVPTEK